MSQHRKTLTFALGLGIALATVLGAASSAQAQYAPGYYYPPPPPPPPPPPRGVYRSGLIWGFGLGLGGFTYSGCGDLCGFSPSGEFHIGGMIGPRLALMGDFWGGYHYFSNDLNNGSGQTWNGVYTLALQYWVNDIVWLKGGLGYGNLTIDSDAGTAEDSGFAFMLAAGIEIVQSYNFALDLQLRYGNATYNGAGADSAGDTNMFTAMVGFNWY